MTGKRLSNKKRQKHARKRPKKIHLRQQLEVIPVKGIIKKMMIVSPEAAYDISRLVNGNRKKECGAFLIGNICIDPKTEMTLVFVNDICTDWKYGSASEYSFSNELQAMTVNKIRKKYGRSARVIGTIHSHGTFSAFFSSVDEVMMSMMGPQMVHMVISPSTSKYVLTMIDANVGHDDGIELKTIGIEKWFRYTRRN